MELYTKDEKEDIDIEKVHCCRLSVGKRAKSLSRNKPFATETCFKLLATDVNLQRTINKGRR